MKAAGGTVLVVDDEPTIADGLRLTLEAEGYRVLTAGGVDAALAHAARTDVEGAIVDLMLPDGDGLALTRELKRRDPAIEVIVVTAYGSVRKAMEATKGAGAFYVLEKPFDPDEVSTLMRAALDHRKLVAENSDLRRRLGERGAETEILTAAPSMQRVLETVAAVADADAAVLIVGESGTGKELIAREIHRRSPRRERPFLDVTLAALPESLIESQLFGHERGAFTDARELKRGLLEIADGGTVFLDEAGEMPLSVQPKLLRVLETHCFKRVGGNRDIQVDVRVIAATNRDLARGVNEGWFRRDLYYRLSGFPIVIPPLRDRPEDIPVLAGYFVSQFNSTLNRNITGFTEQAMHAMVKYPWPGNVRELRNIVERAMVLAAGTVIGVDLLTKDMTGSGEGGGHSRRRAKEEGDQHKSLAEIERDHIRRILAAENGNRSHAAKVLGISRSTLLEKMKKYGIV
jgi:DNA-binding NtrC family response regulator